MIFIFLMLIEVKTTLSRVHVNFASGPMYIDYTSINSKKKKKKKKKKKIKFIPYLDGTSCISAKTEAVKQLHAVFLLTAEQRRRQIRLYRAMVYFDAIDVAWLDVVTGK